MIFDSPKTLGREDFLRLFAEVDQILVSNNPLGDTIKAAVCGGAAIAMMDDSRKTVDVDIISDSMSPELREAIKIVGNRNNLPPDWMNDGAKIWGFSHYFAFPKQRVEPKACKASFASRHAENPSILAAASDAEREKNANV